MIQEMPDFFKKSDNPITVKVNYSPIFNIDKEREIALYDPAGVQVGVVKNLSWEGYTLKGEIHYEPGFSTNYLLQYADPDHRAGEIGIG